MSLQVWLPLNGNLNNQGLSDVTVTNNGATVDSNGKIGSCYSFNTGKHLTVTRPIAIAKEISYSCWVRLSSWNEKFDCIISMETGTEWKNNRATLCRDGSSTHLTWNIANGSSNSRISSSTSLSLNTWYHIACTYNGAKLRIYVNGVEDSSADTSLVPNYDSANLYIGADSGNTQYLNGCLNDVRIYDHCLSAKEVKEISKGLICHYLMNQPEQSPNLSTLPSYIPDFPSAAGTGVFSASTDGISRRLTCTTSGNGGRYNSCFSNSVRLENTTYTWSIDIRASKSMSVSIGLEGGGEVDVNLTTDWQRLSKTAVLSTNTYSAFILYPGNAAAVGDWVEVKLLKVEKNNFATSWSPCSSDYPKWPNNIEYDCSGYKNDGNRIGGISLSNSPTSIRYESHYSFDGDTGCIQIPNLSTLAPSGEFTMNCWVYHDDTWSSKDWETIFGGPSGFELDAKYKATNSPVLRAYSWGDEQVAYELNRWNMITMTRNASETKFYINGELKITGSAGTIPSGNYFVGAWRTSSEQNYKGKISDFRLYSTVLSVEDIKELYNTSASIDKNGNMYAYEFKEE